MTSRKIGSRIFSDLLRGSRLALIVIPISIIAVLGVFWANKTASGDEIAATAAVPLLVSYLMIRGIMWAASGIPDLTDEEKKALEQRRASEPAPMLTIDISAMLAAAFVLGMWWVVAGSISAGVYWALGLNRAFYAAVASVKWTLFVVGGSAVMICLSMLCRAWLVKIARFSHGVFNDPLSFFHGRA
jgi:hypothetical protein